MINCNIANDKLDTKEWERIQAQCIKQKHICSHTFCKNDDLREIIKKDEETLAGVGITFAQLEDFIFGFHLYFKKYSSYSQIDLPDVVNKFYQDKSDKYFTINRNGWCSWGRSYSKFNMFGTNYFVIKFTWGGAETCPFQSPEDKKYHGYSYGSHDWLIWNLDSNKFMHIGDLLFHQITAHKFFQAPGSNYRVDPIKLIELFNLKPNVDYKVDYKEVKHAYYKSASSHSPINDDLLYKCKVSEVLVSTENYVLSKVTEIIKYENCIESVLGALTKKELYMIEKLNKDYKEPIIWNSIVFHPGFNFTLYDLEPCIVKELA